MQVLLLRNICNPPSSTLLIIDYPKNIQMELKISKIKLTLQAYLAYPFKNSSNTKQSWFIDALHDTGKTFYKIFEELLNIHQEKFLLVWQKIFTSLLSESNFVFILHQLDIQKLISSSRFHTWSVWTNHSGSILTSSDGSMCWLVKQF